MTLGKILNPQLLSVHRSVNGQLDESRRVKVQYYTLSCELLHQPHCTKTRSTFKLSRFNAPRVSTGTFSVSHEFELFVALWLQPPTCSSAGFSSDSRYSDTTGCSKAAFSTSAVKHFKKTGEDGRSKDSDTSRGRGGGIRALMCIHKRTHGRRRQPLTHTQEAYSEQVCVSKSRRMMGCIVQMRNALE